MFKLLFHSMDPKCRVIKGLSLLGEKKMFWESRITMIVKIKNFKKCQLDRLNVKIVQNLSDTYQTYD